MVTPQVLVSEIVDPVVFGETMFQQSGLSLVPLSVPRKLLAESKAHFWDRLVTSPQSWSLSCCPAASFAPAWAHSPPGA